jgi:hypothetical protein
MRTVVGTRCPVGIVILSEAKDPCSLSAVSALSGNT